MDLNVQAFRFVQRVTAEEPPPNQAKIESSRKGGIKGGAARAKSISGERRREIALAASEARWSKQPAHSK